MADLLSLLSGNFTIALGLLTLLLSLLLPTVRLLTGRRGQSARMRAFGGPPNAAKEREARLAMEMRRGRRRLRVFERLRMLEPTRKRLRFLGLDNAVTSYVLLVLSIGLFIPLIIDIPILPPGLESPASILAVHYLLNNTVLETLVDRRKQKIKMQVPVAIDTLVRVLKVGRSIEFALQVAAEQVPDPISLEFDAVNRLIALGTAPETALRAVANQLEVAEFDFLVAAYAIHVETGGDLTGALETLSKSTRERINLKAKAEALVAEAKLSSYVIGVLPLLLLAYLSLVNPTYMKPLFDTDQGSRLLTLALFLLGAGVLIIRKLTRIRL